MKRREEKRREAVLSILLATGIGPLPLACAADDADAREGVSLASEADDDDVGDDDVGEDDAKGEGVTPAETSFPVASPPVAMAAISKVSTANNGADYVDECIAAGVPVPATVIDVDEGWQIFGAVADPFMSPELEDARLWTFENTANMAGPDGICMALPRGNMGAASASVVGVICMGWNGKTCYFTNPSFTSFNPIAAIGIDELIGGTDLEDAEEGTCSDCHAGENPFIIHPADPAFTAAVASVSRVFPDAWPTPIVPMSFPGNPEPLDQLGPVASGQLKCDSCHHQGGPGGRFPLLSTDYPRYCAEVLAPAVGEVPPISPTMPPASVCVDDTDCPVGETCEGGMCARDAGIAADYVDHIGWLEAACDVGPGSGVVVPFVPPSLTVPPPDVDPPYRCAKTVRVSNAIYGATLKLYVNSVLKDSGVFRDPEAGYVLKAAAAFVSTDSVQVSQTVGAQTSTKTTVPVLDHTLDYPGGVLPAPIITPAPIYECASAIAAITVPGAVLTTVKTPPGGTAKTYTTPNAAGHSWVGGLGAPAFTVGTTLKMRQRLCSTDPVSAYSATEVVEEAPDSLPPLVYEEPLTQGQTVLRFRSVVQGSTVNLTETGGPTVVFNNASVPYNAWRADLSSTIVKVQAAHHIVPIQTLCGVNSSDPGVPSPSACNVSTLVPEIATPHAGDKFVLVTKSVPGSTVRVFDASTIQIGGGSGVAVDLSRALAAGEVIYVTASLPTCSVNNAYSIAVAP